MHLGESGDPPQRLRAVEGGVFSGVAPGSRAAAALRARGALPGRRELSPRRPLRVPADARRARPAPRRRGPPRAALRAARRPLRASSTASAERAFAVWAPAARAVSVVGDFNALGRAAAPDALARRIRASGSCSSPASATGARYKYEIRTADGELRAEGRPRARSRRSCRRAPPRSCIEPRHEWRRRRLDGARARRPTRCAAPMSIYEVHLGSWRWNTLEGNRLADLPRAGRRARRLRRDLGFTHVELLPVMAHPFGGSWGYQVTSLLRARRRASARPTSFRDFVDRMHRARHRRDPRLGARALPARRLGARPLRRHRALRARRSAPGRAPRLGHADVQLRPPRGAQLPDRQRAVLAARVPRRRAARRRRRLDALPRLLAQAGRVDAQRVRRAARTSRRSRSSRS